MFSDGNQWLFDQLSVEDHLQQLHHHLLLDHVHPDTGDMAATLSISKL